MKVFYPTEEIAERLSKETNQSKTVNEALGRYFEGKDGSKVLAKLVQENTDAMNELAEAVQKQSKLLHDMQTWMNSQGANIRL